MWIVGQRWCLLCAAKPALFLRMPCLLHQSAPHFPSAHSALPLPHPYLPPQNYPPLVEARAGGAPSMSALAVFRDLSEEQWEAFMAAVRCQVARKLRDGAWKQAAASKAPPMMSCPRF